MYRNAAFAMGKATDAADYDARAAAGYAIPHTSPIVTAKFGCASFKTQKILGVRSIVTDSWARTPQETFAVLPGQGQYAHRDGYNILYGDSSVKWYGDSSQALAYIQPEGTSPVASWWPYWSKSIYGDCVWGAGFSSSQWSSAKVPAWVNGFNMFDVSAGIDIKRRY